MDADNHRSGEERAEPNQSLIINKRREKKNICRRRKEPRYPNTKDEGKQLPSQQSSTRAPCSKKQDKAGDKIRIEKQSKDTVRNETKMYSILSILFEWILNQQVRIENNNE